MRQNHQRGFTLIEVLIAAGIAVAILAGLILISNNTFKQTSTTISTTKTQTNVQAINRFLQQDLRTADPTLSTGHHSGSDCAHITTPTHTITYCNTPAGATRTATARTPSSDPASREETTLTPATGSIIITKADAQFFAVITPHENAKTRQLAVTTRLGGN